jgi:hypothetical protein
MGLVTSAVAFAVSGVAEDAESVAVGARGSVMFTSLAAAGLVEVGVVESSGWDGAPVLARLCCFGCSVSDGERERERFLLESDSGIAGCF